MRAAIRGGTFSQTVRGLWLPAADADDLYQRCAAALATQREDAAISRETGGSHSWVRVATGRMEGGGARRRRDCRSR